MFELVITLLVYAASMRANSYRHGKYLQGYPPVSFQIKDQYEKSSFFVEVKFAYTYKCNSRYRQSLRHKKVIALPILLIIHITIATAIYNVQ